MIGPDLRARWEERTLEFFTARGAAIADDWTPRTAKDLAASLTGGSWELLVALNVVASPWTASFFRDLPRLVARELRADWSRQDVVTVGRVKGVIDVPKTIVARAALGTPSALAYRKLQRIWDTEENRTVAGFLSYVERTTSGALRATASRPAWQEEVANSLRQLRSALLSPPLRFVQADPQWSQRVHRLPRRRGSRLYEGSRHVAEAWIDARRAVSGEALRATLSSWLRPATDDALFETYVASVVVDVLYGLRDWDAFRIVPLGFGGRVAEAQADDLIVRVSFDASPETALARPVPGEYKWIFETYDGLDIAARRPDLTVQVLRPGREHVVMFEAKATDANSTYGHDSIYKALGYLKDFDAVWGSPTPRVVLVFASGVSSPLPLAYRADRDLLLTADPTFASDVAVVLGDALASVSA